MQTRYSKTTGTFYPIDIDYGKNLPTDVQLVDDSDYQAAMSRPTGSSFTFTAAGALTITPAQPPAIADIKAAELVKVRFLRAALFPTLAGLQSEALARGNSADAMAIAVVQQQCRDITKADLTACTTQAQVDSAFKAAWLAIVASAPVSVQTAFAGLKA